MKYAWIFFILFTTLRASSIADDRYIIAPKQLNSLSYYENAQHQQILRFTIKERYWEEFFDYTFSHIRKKATIMIGDITIHPYIYEPLYHHIELSGTFKAGVKRDVQALAAEIKDEDRAISIEMKVAFLEKMLVRYDFAPTIAYTLIAEYHALDKVAASQKCLSLYKQMLAKKISIEPVYGEIFDCHMDLNKTKEASSVLALVKPLIPEEQQYVYYERRALVYVAKGQIQQAKKAYQKAIELFQKRDILKGMKLSDEDKKHFQKLQNQELSRLKVSLSDLEKKR